MTSAPRIQTPFGRRSRAAEVVQGVDISGRNAIVTGAASGLGAETARALARAGAAVTLAVRNTDAGEYAAAEIRASTGNDSVHVARVDLLDRATIKAFTDSWSGPLHILVNNAGVMAFPMLERTPDGWELQFASNHLGHFVLAHGLHDALAAAGNARIVSVTSSGHHICPVDFDDINFDSRPYDPWLAYGQSKTANVLFAVGVTCHWASEGISANAVHPGAVMDTNLSRHMDPDQAAELRAAAAAGEQRSIGGQTLEFKNTAQGAATSTLVASSPLLEGVSGRYFEDCNEARVLAPEAVRTAGDGVAPYALDPSTAERLWELSLAAL